MRQMVPSDMTVNELQPGQPTEESRELVDYLILPFQIQTESQLANALKLAAGQTKERGCLVYWRSSGRHQGSSQDLTLETLQNCAQSNGWRLTSRNSAIIWPHSLGLVSRWINQFLGPLIPGACLTEVIVLRKTPSTKDRSCSIIVPARNEAGNLPELLDRIPHFGKSQEIILIEGGSTDETRQVADRESNARPQQNIRVLDQKGRGKGSAMREALRACRGELVFILDADLSVDPEALASFYASITQDDVDFINGDRMTLPMEKGAMRWLNYWGNQCFTTLMNLQLGTHLSDTLCGTKVFYRDDFRTQNDGLPDIDPFGDFSLLLGTRSRHLRIKEVSVTYRARKYGKTNIQRWRDGLRLLRIWLHGLSLTRFISFKARSE